MEENRWTIQETHDNLFYIVI